VGALGHADALGRDARLGGVARKLGEILVEVLVDVTVDCGGVLQGFPFRWRPLQYNGLMDGIAIHEAGA